MNIPGMAIAIVKDDQVIMARGFGVRDIDTNQPADEHTLFAIGSSTKSFTAALAAMLVDEGKVDWDEPIRTYLPEFRLHDEEIAAQVTLRDALSHRTGLNRTDLLWVSGRASRAEILEAIGEAELYSPFREKWHYNNIMFLAAGEAAARVAGSDWDSMLAERILQPLGMSATNSTYEDAQASAALSKGYTWDKDRERYRTLPMRNINSVAPAGSINSTVTDMTQWLRLQLNRGEIDGKRLISEEQIEQMWTACSEVAPSMEYGLGWFVREWRGKRLIEHGGNIDGFASSMSMLPDENIGFVLLKNVSHSPLQEMSHGLVYDALLGDMDGDVAEYVDVDFRRYVGKYHFALMETDFTVLIKGDALAVDVPGQMVYELKPPDENGKWYFAVTDQIAVSFVLDEEGRPRAMKMYQAGLTFELPREGVQHELEVSMEEVGPLLGSYQAEEAPMAVRVLIQHGRLAIDVPGQMVYELHLPDDEGRWVFRATDAIHATFEEEEGEPVLVMHQAGTATRFVRTGGDEAGDIPTVDELLALVGRGHNTGALQSIETIRIVENLRMVHQGITGTITTKASRDGRLTQDMDLGRFGYITVGLAGETAWVDSDIHTSDDELSAEEVDDIRMRHPLALYGDWRETFDAVEVQPNETIKERPAHVVHLIAGTVHRTLRIDAETGVIISEQVSTLIPGIGRMSQRVRYEEHRDVHGLKLPSRTVVESDLMGRMVMTMDSADVNVDISDERWASPVR